MSTTRSATINSSWDGELLGLNASSNGRSCEQHECCGKAVKPDDVIRFKLAVVEAVLGKPLEMIKAIIIKDSTELCTDPLHHSKRGMYHHQKWSKSEIQGHTAQLYQHPLQSWDQWPQWPSPPYLWVSLAPSAELSFFRVDDLLRFSHDDFGPTVIGECTWKGMKQRHEILQKATVL